jgi:4-hydroxythreonine-4-phosphate dehydrogenase
MGDAAGIGPEVCLKAIASGRLCTYSPIVIGAVNVLRKTMQSLKLKMSLAPIKSVDEADFKKGTLNVLDSKGIQLNKLLPGKVSAMCGQASANYVRIAARLAANGKVDAITTAPLSKEAVHAAGLKYNGHTELLSEIFRTKVVMMFIAGNLRMALVTRHLPISQVSRAITKSGILETFRIIHNATNLLGLSEPSIAVLSLNPHRGEGGILGNDEERKIVPAIKAARKSGIKVEGPFPADGFFGSGAHPSFDVIVAMYHDQGLIPYKMTAFGRGVNVTLGLPIIRTSVDHGTAYDIAGRGIANERGMIEALRFASLMVKRKRQ